MRIGIIGAGEMGATLIRQYATVGHEVKMTNASGPEKLRRLASETGASVVALPEAVTDVDVVVVSIPLIAVASLPKDLFDKTPASVPVIDTCNYYPVVSGTINDLEAGMPESVWVSTQLQRPVIKAYNNILYRSLRYSGLPKDTPSRIALPISGDNNRAMGIVASLVNDSGFDSLEYAPLEDSWRQQPGSPVYCTDLTLAQLKNSIVGARKEALSERRELGLKYILKHDPERWIDNVKYNRVIYESELND